MQNETLLPIVALIVGGVVAVTGMVIGNTESTITTIDTSTVIERTIEQPAEDVGGLVVPYQRMFPEGLLIGDRDIGQIGVWQFITDSNDTLFIGSSTDATFSIASDGEIIMRNVSFVTSSLNFAGNFGVGGDMFYVDVSSGGDGIGMGTTTPSYQLEIVSASSTPMLALTATSTNDAGLVFLSDYRTQEWIIYMDDSDDDKLKFTTSTIPTINDDNTGIDILTIDKFGHLELNGTSTFNGRMTVVGQIVGGGNVVNYIATTTGASDLIEPTAVELCDASIAKFSLLAGGGADTSETVQLPTSSDIILECLPNIGDYIKFRVWNYSTGTLAVTFTQRAMASTSLKFLTSTSTLETAAMTLNEEQFGWMTLQNLDGSTTTVDLDPSNGI